MGERARDGVELGGEPCPVLQRVCHHLGVVAHRDRGDCGKVAATGQLAFLLQSRVGTCTPDVLESGRLAFLLALP